MATWIGAQEALYASILWHLDVPAAYVSQVNPTRSVFPGKALVNTAAPSTTHAKVTLRGKAGAWITDLECATSMRPKLFGFDYARVSETYVQGGKKRLAAELTQAQRAANAGTPGERAMMKDLILSTMREGGEVCVTWHMLNPFLPAIPNAKGPDIGTILSLKQNPLFNVPVDLPPATDPNRKGNDAIMGKDLSQIDFVNDGDEVAVARAIVENHANRFGDLLNEILENDISGSKNIWLRLLHEPNIRYFWWGEPNRDMTPADRAVYHENFRILWIFLVDTIKARIKGGRESRLKFVFCINGEEFTDGTDQGASNRHFQAALDAYFPTGSGTQPATLSHFLDRIDVLGLDYYEDWAKDPAASKLAAQYERLKLKVQSVNTAHTLTWEHALTEVSMRTDFQGRLYGKDAESNDAATNARRMAWPKSKRTFFKDAVLPVVRAFEPKWALFWVNRVGNSVIDSYTPSNGTNPVGDPPLFYDAKTNLFVHPDAGADPTKRLEHVEHYFPVYPAEPFYVETLKTGDASGAKSFIRISGVGEDPMISLPGAVEGDKLSDHGEAYKDAILDFFHLVPKYRKDANRANCDKVEKFLKDPTRQRPDLAPPTPNQAEATQKVFEEL